VKHITKKGFQIVYEKNTQKPASYATTALLAMLDHKHTSPVFTASRIQSTETVSNNLSLFTESSLITKMESMNIGTEATYASIVSKIVDRKYIKISSSDGSPVTLTDMTLDPLTGVIDTTQREILHGSYKNRLVSTELGKKVTDLLESNVSAIMKYDYTSNLERQIIQVEQGDKSWQDVVLNCFQTLHPGINAWSKSHSAGLNKRVLNTDSYGPVSVYEGKYSPVIQWSVRTQKKTGKHTRTTNVKQYTPLPQRYNWRDVPIDMIEKIINGYYRDQKRSLHSNLMYKGAGTRSWLKRVEKPMVLIYPYITQIKHPST
jgi:hypothetical protein